MRQSIEVKINNNSKRSFCYYNLNGKRIKVYNWISFEKIIEPNKIKDLKQREEMLKKLKKEIEKDLARDIKGELYSNLYEQSIFKERLPLVIFEHPNEGSVYVAREIAKTIKEKELEGKKCVLGLATGSSPLSIYKELIRMHKEEGLSFKNVITFNLDEYWMMNPTSSHSYHKFMHENLFDHIDIETNNTYIPNGLLEPSKIEKYCLKFESKIEKLGGIDFQLLGIGRNGHIGFNEPGSIKSSITRKVQIEYTTRFDASEEFGGIDNVPSEAITMGIQTILNAKKIILVAWGNSKSNIIKNAVEDEISESVPASLLQSHSNRLFVLDKESSSNLRRFVSPWLYTDINKKPKNILSNTIIGWSDETIKKAVVWLSLKLKKPVLLLTDDDYIENGMGGIFEKYSSSYDANIKVFNMLQSTITGWPGGKPNADDTSRPEKSKPANKRVIIFSPHPDDDVISMGGTFDRLIQQGHDVHVVYQTSGNTAVWDDYIIEIFEQNNLINKDISDNKEFVELCNKNLTKVKKLIKGEFDYEGLKYLNNIKGAIRKSEAYQACKFFGLINNKNIHFLDMPFYNKGEKKESDIGDKDIKVVEKIISKIKPHQIFAAGDLNDPHGTHRLCLRAVIRSLNNLKKHTYIKNCSIWLYKGAWDEWKISEIDMAVPMSPNQVIRKRKAIFKHKSQKDGAVFPGNDNREFWQRAEERNKMTADLYSELGLAKYAAIEGFKKYYLKV